ncbi:uncharacterized protein LOC126076469 [Elephas maximus indicus]|uniref:uncharacterized protein LOC126076469 n=1 Tax=Elephas maximus indicus TaxID=99487 RepID=UPI002115E82C|nr:uncharacterized protein LOC126076469 [Elephas maximus indicus]
MGVELRAKAGCLPDAPRGRHRPSAPREPAAPGAGFDSASPFPSRGLSLRTTLREAAPQWIQTASVSMDTFSESANERAAEGAVAVGTGRLEQEFPLRISPSANKLQQRAPQEEGERKGGGGGGGAGHINQGTSVVSCFLLLRVHTSRRNFCAQMVQLEDTKALVRDAYVREVALGKLKLTFSLQIHSGPKRLFWGPKSPPFRHPSHTGGSRSLIISGQRARLPTEEPVWWDCLGKVREGALGQAGVLAISKVGRKSCRKACRLRGLSWRTGRLVTIDKDSCPRGASLHPAGCSLHPAWHCPPLWPGPPSLRKLQHPPPPAPGTRGAPAALARCAPCRCPLYHLPARQAPGVARSPGPVRRPRAGLWLPCGLGRGGGSKRSADLDSLAPEVGGESRGRYLRLYQASRIGAKATVMD